MSFQLRPNSLPRQVAVKVGPFGWVLGVDSTAGKVYDGPPKPTLEDLPFWRSTGPKTGGFVWGSSMWSIPWPLSFIHKFSVYMWTRSSTEWFIWFCTFVYTSLSLHIWSLVHAFIQSFSHDILPWLLFSLFQVRCIYFVTYLPVHASICYSCTHLLTYLSFYLRV